MSAVRSKSAVAPEHIVERGLEGTVKFYDVKKGFGCLIADDSRKLYVNWRHVTTREFQPLVADARVRFDLARSERPSGPNFEPGVLAVNVEVA